MLNFFVYYHVLIDWPLSSLIIDDYDDLVVVVDFFESISMILIVLVVVVVFVVLLMLNNKVIDDMFDDEHYGDHRDLCDHNHDDGHEKIVIVELVAEKMNESYFDSNPMLFHHHSMYQDRHLSKFYDNFYITVAVVAVAVATAVAVVLVLLLAEI